MMRTPCLLAAAILAAAGPCFAASLSALERQRLLAHYEMTGSWLAGEVAGLSPAQYEFRPAPDAWSILEVVDHLAVSEAVYWQDFLNAMKTPPARPPRAGGDESILWYGIDRARRGDALPAEQPRRKFRDLNEALEAWRKIHASIARHAASTKEDLRAHVVEREQCDAYQWLLLISTHAQRHILQIRELKAGPKFPRR